MKRALPIALLLIILAGCPQPYGPDPDPEPTLFNLTVNVIGNGTANANPSGPYQSGTDVTVTAYPGTGWRLNYWSGDATGTTNPTVVRVTSNMNVTATLLQGGWLQVTNLSAYDIVITVNGTLIGLLHSGYYSGDYADPGLYNLYGETVDGLITWGPSLITLTTAGYTWTLF